MKDTHITDEKNTEQVEVRVIPSPFFNLDGTVVLSLPSQTQGIVQRSYREHFLTYDETHKLISDLTTALNSEYMHHGRTTSKKNGKTFIPEFKVE